ERFVETKILPPTPSALFSGPLGRLTWYSRPTAAPRAGVCFQPHTANDPDAAVAMALAPEFRVGEDVILETIRKVESVREATATVTFVADESQRVELDVQSSATGWLVLRDSFDPGWTATVNDRETEVLRADVTSRAVRIPAGKSRVVFEYWPRTLHAGLWISGTSIALLILVSFATLIPSRRKKPPTATAS
ncbi:MAG: YfhO family protein, partial [Planctomycetota bacterium]